MLFHATYNGWWLGDFDLGFAHSHKCTYLHSDDFQLKHHDIVAWAISNFSDKSSGREKFFGRSIYVIIFEA
jgi:hypothetical protein